MNKLWIWSKVYWFTGSPHHLAFVELHFVSQGSDNWCLYWVSEVLNMMQHSVIVHTHTHIRNRHAYTHTNTHKQIYRYTHLHTHTHTQRDIHTDTHTYIHTRTYKHKHTHIQTHTHTNIHTNTHTNGLRVQPTETMKDLKTVLHWQNLLWSGYLSKQCTYIMCVLCFVKDTQ